MPHGKGGFSYRPAQLEWNATGQIIIKRTFDMKLYHAPTSPYVRKVMVLLHETGQLEDVTLEARATTPLAPDQTLLPSNPLGKVPALERAEG